MGGIKDVLAKIFGSSLIEEVGNTVDQFVTTKEEREALKARLWEIVSETELDAEEQLTRRLEADMKSDSWMAKNIRPLTLIFVMFLYALFSMTSGNLGEFEINEAYVELLGQWGMTIMSFYFGGRSLEKIASTFSRLDTYGQRKRRNRNKDNGSK